MATRCVNISLGKPAGLRHQLWVGSVLLHHPDLNAALKIPKHGIAWLVVVLLSLCNHSFAQNFASTNYPFAKSTQLVLVTTAGWDDVPGKLQRFVRPDTATRWRPFGAEIPVVVGRSGLGWGSGVQPETNSQTAGPRKKEGDGRSPAGIFKLGDAFGLAAASELPNLKLPYLQLNPDIECVDDVKSTHYNRIVNRREVASVDWNSSEHMREVGAQYRIGVVVEHNFEPRIAGVGSCIFMHIWKDARTGTSGCTAMDSAAMDEFITWLDPRAKPMLVQLPKAQYEDLKAAWLLP